MDPLLVGLGVSALIAPILGVVGGFWSGRHASRDSYSDLVLQFEKDRVATAILRDQVDEMLERIGQERKRITGERTRIEAGPVGGKPPPETLPSTDGRDAQIEAVRARYEPRPH